MSEFLVIVIHTYLYIIYAQFYKILTTYNSIILFKLFFFHEKYILLKNKYNIISKDSSFRSFSSSSKFLYSILLYLFYPNKGSYFKVKIISPQTFYIYNRKYVWLYQIYFILLSLVVYYFLCLFINFLLLSFQYFLKILLFFLSFFRTI